MCSEVNSVDPFILLLFSLLATGGRSCESRAPTRLLKRKHRVRRRTSRSPVCNVNATVTVTKFVSSTIFFQISLQPRHSKIHLRQVRYSLFIHVNVAATFSSASKEIFIKVKIRSKLLWKKKTNLLMSDKKSLP